MEENKNLASQLDEVGERRRNMTEERENKRKRILKNVAIGVGVAVGIGAGIAGCDYVMDLINVVPPQPIPVGGAMGQWEEVPMQRTA